MYFDCFNQRGRFREIMDNWFSHSVQIIVVTDGGRILGLGDLGQILPSPHWIPLISARPCAASRVQCTETGVAPEPIAVLNEHHPVSIELEKQHKAVTPHQRSSDLHSYTNKCIEGWLGRPFTPPASHAGIDGMCL